MVRRGGRRGRERGKELGSWKLGDLLFVCVKISNMAPFILKGTYDNVNYIILTYAISNQKGGESDG